MQVLFETKIHTVVDMNGSIKMNAFTGAELKMNTYVLSVGVA